MYRLWLYLIWTTFIGLILGANGINTTFHSLGDANCGECSSIDDCGTEKDGYMCYWNNESPQCDVIVCTLLNAIEEYIIDGGPPEKESV